MNNIIPESLEYYNTYISSSKKISELLNNGNIDLKNITNSKNKQPLEYIVSSDNNKYNLSCQILGYYNKNTCIWNWAWSNNYSRDMDIKICSKILNYGLSLNVRRDDIEIKTKLINSQIYIADITELEIFISIISYLSHNVYLYWLKLNDNEKICIQLNLNELKKFNLI